MPIRAFLSHASLDKPFVEEVKRFLEEGGDIECWLDTFEIGFGENIVSRINDGLAQSDFLLLFLSPTSLKSRWLEEKCTASYSSKVNPATPRLIAVLLGNAKPPPLLQNKKY